MPGLGSGDDTERNLEERLRRQDSLMGLKIAGMMPLTGQLRWSEEEVDVIIRSSPRPRCFWRSMLTVNCTSRLVLNDDFCRHCNDGEMCISRNAAVTARDISKQADMHLP